MITNARMGEEVVMERLTKRTAEGIAYLANVKQDEQVIEGSRNTLQCLYDSWQKLAEYEDKIEVGDLIKVVRCKDCKDWGVVHPSNKSKKCNFWSSKEEHLYTVS